MKVLIITQSVDSDDSVLGFFTHWITEFAKHFERIEIICLKEGLPAGQAGKHDLPANVMVHSLGKERGAASRAAYVWRFISLAWQLRREYDAVFVHMNQEYVIIAGWLWKLLGKRAYLWRNHYAGSWLTGIAAAFCTNIFCTSKNSFTAKYTKTFLMPVGVDIEQFYPDERIIRKPHSILFLGRMSPSKRPEMLIEALASLARKGINFTASFVGSSLPKDEEYYKSLKERIHSIGLCDRISFHPAIANSEAPDMYRKHEIFVNCSPSGMFDKTIFEAAACGCNVLAASTDFAALAGAHTHFDSSDDLVERLAESLVAPIQRTNQTFIKENSLSALGVKIERIISVHSCRSRIHKTLVWRTLDLFARLLPHSPRMTALLYHSVSISPEDVFAVSPEQFEAQMRYLQKNFDVVPLSRAFAHAAGIRVARDSVSVTFDDGYSDFVTEALPILKRYGIPATVFVLGESPDRRELGNDHQLLTKAEAVAINDPLFTIGSHTLSHVKLTKIPLEMARQEMKDSRRVIADHFGTAPAYISYPKGSYNQEVVHVARETGYEGAVSVIERGVRVGDSQYALPRVQVDSSTTEAKFHAKLSPAVDWYYTIWHLLKRKKKK